MYNIVNFRSIDKKVIELLTWKSNWRCYLLDVYMSTDRECFVIYSKWMEASESISLQMTQGSVLEAAIFISWRNCFYAVFNSKINNTRCHCIGWYFWSTNPYVMSREFSQKNDRHAIYGGRQLTFTWKSNHSFHGSRPHAVY